MKRILVAAVAVLATVTLAACGVPSDSKPRSIPSNQVPFDLLATSTTSTATTLPVSTVKASVFMIGPNHLVAVQRNVPAPLTLGSALASLVQGPTNSEQTEGLRSALNSTTSVLSAQINDKVAMINISDSFTGIGLQDQIFGLAQLVYTATELPGVSSVQISINGKQDEVPRGDGSATSGLLTRADYTNVGPS